MKSFGSFLIRNLDMIICGGAALDPKYEAGMHDFGIEVYNGYGMSEIGITSVELRKSAAARNEGSIGRRISIHHPRLLYDLPTPKYNHR